MTLLHHAAVSRQENFFIRVPLLTTDLFYGILIDRLGSVPRAFLKEEIL